MRTRPTTVLVIVAALVVLLAVVAAVVSQGRARPPLDASTPEGVVQLYISALFEDNIAGAVEYVDPALGCSDPLPENYIPDAARVSVAKTTTSGDTANVELRIEEGSGFDSIGSYHNEYFSLRRDNQTWLITGEPWPIYYCE